jgi:hypothetical protein
VKSKDEILATLDRDGRLDGLPFMPEMFEYCGRRLRVSKRAHKTCDPPSGLAGRRMLSTVHLEDIRCDGQAHGGCQAGCLFFWKEAWLKPADRTAPGIAPAPRSSGCSESDVWSGTRRVSGAATEPEPVYVCQSTQIPHATQPLAWWDLRQYIEDYTSGNVRFGQLLAALVFTPYAALAEAGVGLGSAMRWAYDRFQAMRGGAPYPRRRGSIPIGSPTPADKLDLKAGERVKVRSYRKILDTLNELSHNRGMYFDGEQVPFCDGTYHVLRRVERLIDEKTGKMVQLKNDAIVLRNVVCEARYASCRRFCPRAIYPYWREIWLERV